MTRRSKKGSSNEQPVFDQSNVLAPIRLSNVNDRYNCLYDNEKDYMFVKLLEAINIRALDFPVHSKFPSMDLSALYCLGVTIQEYARYLGTDLLTEKRATENLPPLNTLFDQQEIASQQLTSIIETHKQIRPIKQDLVNKNVPYYEKMLRSQTWENTLKKKRNPEADAIAAKIRREKNEIRIQKNKIEKALKQEEARQKIGQKRVKTEYILPPTPPADVFDMSRKKPTSMRKKRKIVNPF